MKITCSWTDCNEIPTHRPLCIDMTTMRNTSLYCDSIGLRFCVSSLSLLFHIYLHVCINVYIYMQVSTSTEAPRCLSHCPESTEHEKYRERTSAKCTPVYSGSICTSLIQLGTKFAVEPTLMKLSSYAQRDPASPSFHALPPLIKYATIFR